MSLTDGYATNGTVADPKALARDLAATLMKFERVPDIRIFRRNTASFVHATGDSSLTDRIWVLLTEARQGGWACGAMGT